MTDFQSLVDELRQMALSETPGQESQWTDTTHSARQRQLWAEKYVRDNALSHPESQRFPNHAAPEDRAAIERARAELADEIIETQRSSYRSASRYARRVDEWNRANPKDNHTYPAWVRSTLSLYEQLMPAHERHTP